MVKRRDGFHILFLFFTVLGLSSAAIPVQRNSWVTLRGGQTSPTESYASKCDVVLQSVLQSARVDMEKYAEEIDSGSCVVDFGAKCDAICNAALESFSSKAPSAGGDTTLESTFDTKVRTGSLLHCALRFIQPHQFMFTVFIFSIVTLRLRNSISLLMLLCAYCI